MKTQEKGSWRVYLNRNFLGICLINFILNLGQFMMNTLLPKYADFMGASATIVGLITSVFSITGLLIKPFSGAAMDSLNNKKILLSGLVCLLITFIGYGFTSSIPALIVFRLLHGLSMGIAVIACLTMATNSLPEDRITEGIAYYSVMQALATAVGPSVGLLLQERYGYHTAFFVAAGFSALAVLLTLLWNVPQTTSKKRFKVSIRSSVAVEALLPAATMMALAAVYVSISSFLVLYAESQNISGIGTFFTVYAVALLIGRPVGGRLAKKYGLSKIILLAICLFAAGMLLISLADRLAVYLVAAVLVAWGYGTCQPLVQAMCIQSVSADRRGAASATSYYGTDSGYLLAPVLCGFIIERAGYAVMFRSMIFFLVLAVGFLCLATHRRVCIAKT